MRLWMVSFCAGIVVIAWSPVLVGTALSVVLVTLPLIVCCLQTFYLKSAGLKSAGLKSAGSATRMLNAGCISASLMLAGIGYSSLMGQWHLEESIPSVWQGKTVRLCGTVVGLPRHNNHVWQFMLENVSIENQMVKGRLKLSWYSHYSLKPGQHWQLRVKMTAPHGVTSPGAFDIESWLRREHVAGTGYVIQDTQNKCIGEDHWRIDTLRNRLASHLKQILPDQDSGLAQALLLGNKGAISQDDWLLFNRTGTTHLLVISGLHIGLMFMLGYACLRGLRYTRLLPLHSIALPRLAVITGLCLSVIYALLAGFSVPVQRALIMLLCGCAGKLLDFSPRPSTVWLVAMVGVLLLEPMAVTSNGFWYSFIAVASLLLVFSNRIGVLPWWKRWWLPQWSVFIALFPLLLYYGQPSTWWSPLINLVSIPLIGLLIVPALMVGTLISLLPLHIGWPLRISVELLNSWRDGLAWIASRVDVPTGQGIADWFILLFCCIGGFYLLLPRGVGWRWFALPCVLLIWYPAGQSVLPGTVKITVLDDRRTQIAVVQTAQHVLIYDMGDRAQSERFNGVQSTLLPFLRQQHIRKADVWVLPRHSSTEVAGRQLQQSVQINATYAAHPQAHELACYQVKTWYWDKVKFTLLPEKNTCVLQVEAATHKALLSGTLSAFRAKQWMKKQPHLASDLWITSSLYSDTSLASSLSPCYIALSQHQPYKARRQVALFNTSGAMSRCQLGVTAYTGAQSYLLGKEPGIKVTYARDNDKRWWRYEHAAY